MNFRDFASVMRKICYWYSSIFFSEICALAADKLGLFFIASGPIEVFPVLAAAFSLYNVVLNHAGQSAYQPAEQQA